MSASAAKILINSPGLDPCHPQRVRQAHVGVEPTRFVLDRTQLADHRGAGTWCVCEVMAASVTDSACGLCAAENEAVCRVEWAAEVPSADI